MNDGADIADLYSKTLRELARDPAYKGKPEAFDATARGDAGNPRTGSVQGNATATTYPLNTNYDLAYSF